MKRRYTVKKSPPPMSHRTMSGSFVPMKGIE
jgi:hypothetical protein